MTHDPRPPSEQKYDDFDYRLIRVKAKNSHLFFTRYFFKARQNLKFKVNWHHMYLAEELEKVFTGETKNLVINVSPGSSKTELAVINFIARGLALNPWARFLHVSYSDDLALLNSTSARDLVQSDEYQRLFPMKIASDASAKKRWNVEINGKLAGGVYAVSLGGQITGFRAGHMADGWNGAIILDDPLKPGDAYSKAKVNNANRQLVATIESRKASPDTPIIVIMQRISVNDTTGFIKNGGFFKDYRHIVIPAIIDDAYVATLPEHIRPFVKSDVRDEHGRFSYWQDKEPLEDLLRREQGGQVDASGSRISKHVFSAQYQQNPVVLGGDIIRGEHFRRYSVLPPLEYRAIYGDTAQKTGEANDYSVFECWGKGKDGSVYLLDLIRGKWTAPELKRRCVEFWNKHKAQSDSSLGSLREMVVEDKSSGTGLIQDIKLGDIRNGVAPIPVRGRERNKDKLTRVMDVLTYIEAGLVSVPANAPFTSDFIDECEAFTADDTHAHDDQIDPMCDAVSDMCGQKKRGFFS